MPLDKATITTLKTNLKKARKKHMQFFYCKSGPEDEPVLLIDKRVKSAGAKLKKVAKKKLFVTGAVHFDHTDKVLAFVTPTPKAHHFARNLKMFFGKAPGLQDLKKAKVITPEEDQESNATDEADDAVETGDAKQSDGEEETAKLHRSIEKYQDVFLADPTQAPDKLLSKLVDRLSTYGDAGGVGDFGELIAAVERERARRPVAIALTTSLTEVGTLRDEIKAAFDGLKDLTEDTVTERKMLIKDLGKRVKALRKQRDAYAKILGAA